MSEVRIRELEAEVGRVTRERDHEEARADKVTRMYGEAAVERDRLRLALVGVVLVFSMLGALMAALLVGQ